jgi:hypothetical protein
MISVMLKGGSSYPKTRWDIRQATAPITRRLADTTLVIGAVIYVDHAYRSAAPVPALALEGSALSVKPLV